MPAEMTLAIVIRLQMSKTTPYEHVIGNKVYPKLFETINFFVVHFFCARFTDNFGLELRCTYYTTKRKQNQYGLKMYRHFFGKLQTHFLHTGILRGEPKHSDRQTMFAQTVFNSIRFSTSAFFCIRITLNGIQNESCAG